MTSKKWIKFKKKMFIGLDFDYKHNPLIDWDKDLKLKGSKKTIGYDFLVIGYRKVEEEND